MANASRATHISILKDYYTGVQVMHQYYKYSPLHMRLPPDTSFVGKQIPQPVLYGKNPKSSGDLAKAIAQQGNSSLGHFNFNVQADYSIAQINNKLLRETRNDIGAFLDAGTLEINGALGTISDKVDFNFFKPTGGGYRGIISAINGNVIVLTNTRDAQNFEPQQTIESAADDDSATVPRAVTALVEYSNPKTGEVTFKGGAAPVGWAVGDYLYNEGDRHKGWFGFEDYIPRTAPGNAESFQGLVRKDNYRLIGLRDDYSNRMPEEALSAVLTDFEYVPKGTHKPEIWISPDTYKVLEDVIKSRSESREMTRFGVGYSYFMWRSRMGIVPVISWRRVPPKRAFVIDWETWKCYSLGPMPDTIPDDGIEGLRQAGVDGIQYQYGGYYNFLCNAPGYNGNYQILK